MRRRLIPTVLLLFVFVGLDGCKKPCPRGTGCVSKKPTPPPPPPPSQTPTLDSAANVAVSGQSVTLTNNSTSQTSGFSLTFSNAGDLTCNDVSIDTTAAYGFLPNGSSFIPSPVTSTMPQYSCAKSGSQITLSSAPPLTEGFHLWVDKFNINMGTTVFTVTVNTTPPTVMQLLTRGAQAAMNLNTLFEGCGLRGTVLQRVFDCSKKVTNYAVSVNAANSASGSSVTNPDGTSTYYTLFTDPNTDDPDLFWFVVGCPSGSGGTVPQQSCTWLTPIVPAGNPALDSTGPGTFPTFQLSLLTGYQQRLLWSGKMIRGGSGYNFADANGFTEPAAQAYPSLGTVNPGVIPTTAQPTPSPASVCNAASGGALTSGTFPASDANVRDIVSLSSGATMTWQMSSYAMENILAGGTPTTVAGINTCPATGGTHGRPFCNTPTGQSSPNFTNEGFNAINVPGFSMTNSFSGSPFLEILWSSSSNGGSFAWAFFALNVTSGGNVLIVNPSLLFGARCASPAWY